MSIVGDQKPPAPENKLPFPDLVRWHGDQPAAGEGINPKDAIGAKKAPLRLVPPALLIETAAVMKHGAEKYGPYNWREQPVKLSIYIEAILRHALAVQDGQWVDPESGRPHFAHIAASAGIILDAAANNGLEYDIHPGPAAELLAAQDVR